MRARTRTPFAAVALQNVGRQVIHDSSRFSLRSLTSADHFRHIQVLIDGCHSPSTLVYP